jgi:antitoxin component of MazEF toxin-antitoxin module
MSKKIIITKISQWGNGYGIRLPKSIVEEAPDMKGCELTVSLKENSMIITKNMTKKVISKEEFVRALKKMKPVNDEDVEEINWGKPVGNEIW